MGFGDNSEHRAHNATAAAVCHNTWRHIQEGSMHIPPGILTRFSRTRVLYIKMKHKEIGFDCVD